MDRKAHGHCEGFLKSHRSQTQNDKEDPTSGMLINI